MGAPDLRRAAISGRNALSRSEARSLEPPAFKCDLGLIVFVFMTVTFKMRLRPIGKCAAEMDISGISGLPPPPEKGSG